MPDVRVRTRVLIRDLIEEAAEEFLMAFYPSIESDPEKNARAQQLVCGDDGYAFNLTWRVMEKLDRYLTYDGVAEDA